MSATVNLRGGWALIRSTWSSWLAARSFFFVLAFGWMIPPLIYLFVWSTAGGAQTAGGLSRGEFVAYYLVLIIVNQITYSQTNWTVGDLIRFGDMNRLLLRPLSPLYNTLSTEVAGKVVYLIFDVPIVIGLALILRPEFHLSLSRALAFVPALLLAWLLRFFWGYWLALLAFWATRADALLAVQDALVFLLAGPVAPLALLPGALQSLAVILPFRYMVGFPVELVLGKLSLVQALEGLAAQVVWVLLSLLLIQQVWRAAVRVYSAVGT